jgi:hypothetical protein
LLAPVVVIGILGSAAWYWQDDLRDFGSWVRDRARNVVPVDPAAATASSSSAGHGPGRLLDGLQDRYWAPRRPGVGGGQFVRFAFAEPVDLRYINIAAGASAERDEFLDQARPATVLLRLKTDTGKINVWNLTLKDKPGAQRFAIRFDRVVTARLEVTSAAGVRDNRRVAIAEVEFFRQS